MHSTDAKGPQRLCPAQLLGVYAACRAIMPWGRRGDRDRRGLGRGMCRLRGSGCCGSPAVRVAIRGVSHNKGKARCRCGVRSTGVTYSSRLRGTKRSSSLTGGWRMLLSDDLPAAGVGFSLKAVVVVVVVVVIVGLMK